ncbi:MAG: ArsR family transcriptional regulator [Betaproteobacteria bacterium]|nr:ArsR family transcriptional regulator [Betaproteobacteria bacterium]
MSGPALRSASKSLSADDEVFDLAARTFRVMSAPMRLKIISSLCEGEKSVTQLLDAIQTTQPNMSQHLASLYRADLPHRSGILTPRSLEPAHRRFPVNPRSPHAHPPCRTV